MDTPVFHYDFASPYSYFAASRIEALIPGVRWQPIFFGGLLATIGKMPWSVKDDRAPQMDQCEERAAELGLELSWPPGWPQPTAPPIGARAATVAADHGRVRELSLALYAQVFREGRNLDIEAVREAAAEAGLDPEVVAAGVAGDDVKARVRAATDAAVGLGVTGIPNVQVGNELFWGDDRLEDAADAARRAA